MERPFRGIEVSDESLPAFRVLSEFEQSEWAEFLSQLDKLYMDNLDKPKLVSALLASGIKGLTPITVDLLFQIGLSVYGLASEMGVAPDVAASIAGRSLDRKLKSSGVGGRLVELVTSDAIWSLHKIHDVVSDKNFEFKEARVITELRPVFGKSVKEKPLAFAVMHQLKIGYVKDFQIGEMFVCLNNAEIEEMIEELKRAQEKAESLKVTTRPTGVYVLQNSGA